MTYFKIKRRENWLGVSKNWLFREQPRSTRGGEELGLLVVTGRGQLLLQPEQETATGKCPEHRDPPEDPLLSREFLPLAD